jgi:hypothetical protein
MTLALSPALLSTQTTGAYRGPIIDVHVHAHVTERSNAATEERLKSGHAVGGLSIV